LEIDGEGDRCIYAVAERNQPDAITAGSELAVNILAALNMVWQALGTVPLFMDPERSSTIMMTTSRRDALPLALMVVEKIWNQPMK
jgi:hypothetical protein